MLVAAVASYAASAFEDEAVAVVENWKYYQQWEHLLLL